MNESEVLKIFSNCVPVRGYRRSIIYDLLRNEFKFIPNALYEILETCKNKTRKEILDKFKPDAATVSEYLDFLMMHEYIFWVEKKDIKLFPEIDFTAQYPGPVSSLIIDVEPGNKINWNQLAEDAFRSGVKHIVFFFSAPTTIAGINLVIRFFKSWPFRGLILNLRYHTEMTSEVLQDFALEFEQVSEIYVYQSPSEHKHLVEKQGRCEIIFTRQHFNAESTDKTSVFKNFRVNIPSFCEAQSHNLFYNRKLIIASPQSELLRTYSTQICIDYKDIQSINNAIRSHNVQKVWNTPKSQVTVCKDCEFRYMCADRSAPLKNKDGQWFQSNECLYNPYLALWKGDQGYKTLSGCKIINDENGFFIPQDF